ncbi:GxGYxYP domain-containing protein, partial [Clostridium perfringens]
MSEKSAQDFYNGEHFRFLNDFYNKYKSGGYETSSQSFKNDISTSNDLYIKNSIIPKCLYVISENYMSKEEQTMISALQGIVSNKSDQQIYILTSMEPDYKVWLQDLNSNYNVKYKTVKDPWVLLSKFKSYINGYILYSNSNLSSINNACSLASLKDSIVIDESLESKVKSYGITNLIEDCRNTDKYWAYNN